MTVEALEIPTKPYTGEKARLSRAYDYLILVLALFLLIGAFHLHVALTAGDWDFWVDWKDRQWWPLVTPLMMITFPAAVQSLLWSNFRLPMGATLCISCLLIGSWIARIFAYHLWNYFPINEVLPATMLPSALVAASIYPSKALRASPTLFSAKARISGGISIPLGLFVIGEPPRLTFPPNPPAA